MWKSVLENNVLCVENTSMLSTDMRHAFGRVFPGEDERGDVSELPLGKQTVREAAVS